MLIKITKENVLSKYSLKYSSRPTTECMGVVAIFTGSCMTLRFVGEFELISCSQIPIKRSE